jgi:ribonuclease HI
MIAEINKFVEAILSNRNFECFVDGGCNNKTHSGAYGSFAVFGKNCIIKSETFLLDLRTSNEAEYGSLIRLLEYISSIHKTGSYWEVFSDSKLMVSHVNDKWEVKSKNLVDLYTQAKYFIDKINLKSKIVIKWVPRKNIVRVLGH